jgi:tetratricopeptide (TPR) repeat protein
MTGSTHKLFRRRKALGALCAPALLAIVLLSFRVPARAQDTPAKFDAVAARATSAREQNDIPRAIELYRQAVELNPKWPDGWWFLGLLQYGTDAYPGARDAFARYIELTPNAGPATALRGLCEYEIGDFPRALADIQKGLSLGAANQPRNAQILYFHEALLLAKAGWFEDALGVYASLATKADPNPEMLSALGSAGLRNPVLPKDIDPGQKDLFLAAGNAAFLFMSGHEADAHLAFQDLFTRFPSAQNAHLLYGYLLFAKDPDLAVAEFKRELEVSPANGTAHALLAWASLLGDNPAEALPNAQKAATEEPGVATAQLVLGRSLVGTGDVKSGLAHLEAALRIEPNNLETHLALAHAYAKAGRDKDAKRERVECLQRTSGEAQPVARP